MTVPVLCQHAIFTALIAHDCPQATLSSFIPHPPEEKFPIIQTRTRDYPPESKTLCSLLDLLRVSVSLGHILGFRPVTLIWIQLTLYTQPDPVKDLFLSICLSLNGNCLS